MARKNVKTPVQKLYTHEGGIAKRINAEEQLRRSVMACLLWEKSFYEDGESIANRIKDAVSLVEPSKVLAILDEARNQMQLRHVPLWMTVAMARSPRHRGYVRKALRNVIQRVDEIAEFVSLYWIDGKVPLAKQVKLGLADCFNRFDEYQLEKWRGASNEITLRDVMFLVRPRPVKGREELFKRIANDTMEKAQTWERKLSAKSNKPKKERWEEMLKSGKLGDMALLRNLRNMLKSDVDTDLIRAALKRAKMRRVLPFRFISAEKYAPQLSLEIEEKMLESIRDSGLMLDGLTAILVDVSYSMEKQLSSKSEMKRIDAACAVGMIGREIFSNCRVFSFSQQLVEVANRKGFGLRDAILKSQYHGNTALGSSIQWVNGNVPYKRIIVITDEQANSERIPAPLKDAKAYLINVSIEQNGVGYREWTHIDGWSEHVIRYIAYAEGKKVDAYEDETVDEIDVSELE